MNIEPLESRIAPAVLLAADGKSATYTDVDGDLVKITTSAGAFVFNNGPDGDFGDSFVFTTANADGGQQLIYVDLTLGGFEGTDFTVSATKAGKGDGLAVVGLIQGPALGVVKIDGDLSAIDCGDNTTGLELLSVRSMGRYGALTQPGLTDLHSEIRGSLGALRVAADIKDAWIDVTTTVNADATIGSITIGGSLIGGTVGNSGSITAESEIGPVKVGRDIVGGDGSFSGRISSGAKVGAVTIGGSLVGGAGNESGSILGNGGIGTMKIGGNVVGGLGDTSGRVAAFGQPISSVSIGGSLLGGAGNNSGEIYSNNSMGPVKVRHDVVGGGGDFSGSISSDTNLGTIAIAGSLLGGGGESSAAILAVGDTGGLTIGHDVKGGGGVDSARIEAGGTLGAITIGGSLLGGSASGAGSIGSGGGIGAVKIGHDIRGGSASFTALISTDGPLTAVTVGGSLIGGTGTDSGKIKSEGNMGAVKIGRDLLGGTGSESGVLRSTLQMTSVTIGGSLVGASLGSGSADSSGAIIASGGLGPVRIGHDLVGGSISGAATLERSGFIESAGRIASVFIGGSLVAGTDGSTGELLRSATIRAGADLGSVTVAGGLIGNVGPQGESFVTVSAQGQAGLAPTARADVAIGRIFIGGRAEFAQIFAGYNRALEPHNADAQIGSVHVGADWATSSIVAGAANEGADPGPGDDNIDYGNPFDVKITGGTDVAGRFSKIGRIEIVGQAFGVPGSSRDFGLAAEEIGALKIGGATFTLDPGRNNDGQRIGQLPHFALHEINALIGSTVTFLNSAKLVNASTVTYDDIDGDHVTVRFSKPLLTNATVANSAFTFDTGMIGDGVPARQQLQLIDLTGVAAAGASITVTVVPGGGDRLAHVGAIFSDDDLGTITIPGDLGQIAAGDATAATRGLAALNVRTLGRLGLDTQPAMSASFTPFLGGDIIGGLGALAVKQDIAGSSLAIAGALGPLTIGGSLIGGGAAASGSISAQSIGAVKIGHHVQRGSVAGSGFIDVGTSIASVSVGGSLIGANINADGTTLGAVRIGHNVLGGLGASTGRLTGNTGIGNITIGGSLLGGLGDSSGQIFSDSGGIGAVRIGHNLVGGAGDESGKIDSDGKLASLAIGGSLLGGSGDYDTTAQRGQVAALGSIGPVTIGHNLHGGTGDSSAEIETDGAASSVTIGGSLIGGSGSFSGAVFVGALGAVKIGHDLIGGSGGGAGYLDGADGIASVTIGGSLVGGASSYDGAIVSDTRIGPVRIGHDMLGGSGGATASMRGTVEIASVSIGGSLVGGSAVEAGSISGGNFGAVKIGRDLIGGSIAGTAATLDRTGYIEAAARIASVSIGGSIIAGIDDSTVGALTTNASIRAGADLGALSVRGSLIGNVGDGTAANLSKVIISASGHATLAANATLDLAIKSVSIGGRVERAQILAGYSTALGVDRPGSIGPVSVGGDWIASDLVAGAMVDDDPTAPNLFGDFDDIPITAPGTAIVARIAAISIKGAVFGTDLPVSGDHFGFVSHVIGSFKSLGIAAVLSNSPIRDVIELSLLTRDVTVREV